MQKENKKFISIIWGYHKQIYFFEKEQNYHMLPIDSMKEKWFNCEILAINSHVKIEDDPNFIKWTKVIYYKNIFHYLYYLYKNRKEVIYSNSLTIKTLLVWIIWKRTVFCPHSFPFWHNKIKAMIISFFYKFFNKIRINNIEESKLINEIKPWLWFICPLSISNDFLVKDYNKDRNWAVWIWNITAIKNPKFLLDTCKILKDKTIKFKINIIWEDRFNLDGKTFSDLVKDNSLENYIKILWFIPHKDLKEELKKSLIYINTSISEWQCLSVYEWALAWNILCLQNILSFPSIFWENAFYHNTPEELVNNIIYSLENKDKLTKVINENQRMILKDYNYNIIKDKFWDMFNSL